MYASLFKILVFINACDVLEDVLDFQHSFSSVAWPRGLPRAGCNSFHDGTIHSFTGIRHCSREDSRHLTWLSSQALIESDAV